MCIYTIYIYIYTYILQHIQTRESHTTCLFVSLLTSNLAKNSSRSKCLVGTQSTLGLPPCFVQRPGSFWGGCVIITSVSRLSKNRSSRLLKLVLVFLVASCCINKNLPELLETGKSFAFQRPWQSPWCHSKLHGDAPRTVVPVGVPTKDTLGIVRVWLPHFQHTVLKRFSIRSKVIFIHSLNWSPGKNLQVKTGILLNLDGQNQ